MRERLWDRLRWERCADGDECLDSRTDGDKGWMVAMAEMGEGMKQYQAETGARVQTEPKTDESRFSSSRRRICTYRLSSRTCPSKGKTTGDRQHSTTSSTVKTKLTHKPYDPSSLVVVCFGQLWSDDLQVIEQSDGPTAIFVRRCRKYCLLSC